MKKLLLAIMILSGCTIQVQPTPDIAKAVQQNAIILDAIVTYIHALQEKGVLPKPEEEKK